MLYYDCLNEIMVNLIKLIISSIRWGNLSDSDVLLIKKSGLVQVFRANYIRKTSISQKNIATLD